VMVVDRSGIHRAHKLDTTFDHYDGQLRFHFLPAHCGCVFRSKVATDSDRTLPPIPAEGCH
jgi:hypothetical protein